MAAKKKQKDDETVSASPTPPDATPSNQWQKPENPGRRFQIRTPNGGFNGERGGVKIQEGTGYTDDCDAAAHCRAIGYAVVDSHDEASARK